MGIGGKVDLVRTKLVEGELVGSPPHPPTAMAVEGAAKRQRSGGTSVRGQGLEGKAHEAARWQTGGMEYGRANVEEGNGL